MVNIKILKQKVALHTKTFFGKHPDALKLVENMTDQEIEDLKEGVMILQKSLMHIKKPMSAKDKPSVILAFTIKGYGIGSRQADNTTHQVKKLNLENLKHFKEKFNLPVEDSDLDDPPFLRFKKNSKEYNYLIAQRKKLNGFLPSRNNSSTKLKIANYDIFKDFDKENLREQSTTMIFVKILTNLLRDKGIAKHVVPIVPEKQGHLAWMGYLDSSVYIVLKGKNTHLKMLIK